MYSQVCNLSAPESSDSPSPHLPHLQRVQGACQSKHELVVVGHEKEVLVRSERLAYHGLYVAAAQSPMEHRNKQHEESGKRSNVGQQRQQYASDNGSIRVMTDLFKAPATYSALTRTLGPQISTIRAGWMSASQASLLMYWE